MAKRKIKGYIPSISSIIARINQAGAEKLGIPVWAAVVSAATAGLKSVGLTLKNDRETAIMLAALMEGFKYGSFAAACGNEQADVEGKDVDIRVEPGRVEEGA